MTKEEIAEMEAHTRKIAARIGTMQAELKDMDTVISQARETIDRVKANMAKRGIEFSKKK